MKQKKRYEDALRDDLIRLNLYNERNERLISAAAMCSWFIDLLEDDVRKRGVTIYQVGSMRQGKETPNPHVESIRKYNRDRAYIYARLGLGNEADMNEIQDNELEAFLKEITE